MSLLDENLVHLLHMRAESTLASKFAAWMLYSRLARQLSVFLRRLDWVSDFQARLNVGSQRRAYNTTIMFHE